MQKEGKYIVRVMGRKIVKVSWSGGKDSTCAADLNIEAGYDTRIVCYIPMFTQTIPLILKDHYEHILNTAEYFRHRGAYVEIVTGETYLDHFLRRASRGENKGRMFCFPLFQRGWCNFKRDSKEKALKNCDIGKYDWEDIGIAYDETDRQNQLNERMRSILVEKMFTEAAAYKYCMDHGILSPHYGKYKRDGCVLCPNASAEEREEWFSQYPESRELVIALQNIARAERPEQTPLREHQWFIRMPNYEGYQFSLGDYDINEKDLRIQK